MLELHLKQPGFNSAYVPFTNYCKRIQKFRKTGNLKHLYRNELDKACFAHNAAYSDSKDLANKTISDKILKDTAYEIAGMSVNEQLSEELHKPVTKKSKEEKSMPDLKTTFGQQI